MKEKGEERRVLAVSEGSGGLRLELLTVSFA